MKLWELHSLHMGGAIRTTPDGEAEIAGLILSEKAYLVVMRDFRPAQFVELVTHSGVGEAARALSEHYGSPESLAATGGRGLVITRSRTGGTGLMRADEVGANAATGRHV
jgi:hypothetical protein